MKKQISLTLCCGLLAMALSGCGSATEKINVISREEGSGTRGAFVELFGVEEKGADGTKMDNTLASAEITNNTAVMMTSIARDKSAIGYISLGSLNDTVKALPIDGVQPSAEAIKNGSYTVARPFNIATNGQPDGLAQNFIAFMLSAEGQAVVEAEGYITLDGAVPFEGTKGEGKLVVAGSSSVAPMMQALKEAYEAANPNATIEIQQSDSTTGMSAALDGICDIGMASRALKDSETEKGLVGVTIALDGIAVVVNNENPISGLTTEQVNQIYTGIVTNWTQLA